MSPFPLPRVTESPPEEPTSFDAVYRAYAADVARWAKRLGGPGIDADETVQDVFLIVDRKLSSFRGDAKLGTWLFRITARIAANQRRAARRRQGWARLTRRMEEQVPEVRSGPAEELERQDAARRFYRVLDELPERQRRVLILFELEELSTDEIAGLVDRPAATVRVWLHRGRARFIAGWQRCQQKDES